jgi:hypothetical protein
MHYTHLHTYTVYEDYKNPSPGQNGWFPHWDDVNRGKRGKPLGIEHSYAINGKLSGVL